jgi:hypothetical protein
MLPDFGESRNITVKAHLARHPRKSSPLVQSIPVKTHLSATHRCKSSPRVPAIAHRMQLLSPKKLTEHPRRSSP